MSQEEKALRKSIEAMIKVREALKKTAKEIAEQREREIKAGLVPKPPVPR